MTPRNTNQYRQFLRPDPNDVERTPHTQHNIQHNTQKLGYWRPRVFLQFTRAASGFILLSWDSAATRLLLSILSISLSLPPPRPPTVLLLSLSPPVRPSSRLGKTRSVCDRRGGRKGVRGERERRERPSFQRCFLESSLKFKAFVCLGSGEEWKFYVTIL